MVTTYFTGLHKLLTLKVQQPEKLVDSIAFINFSDLLIAKYNLEKVGISVHNFENNSFTIAICLKESHICVHTWPEFNTLTLDIYLCNFLADNSDKVQAIAKNYISYFNAETVANHDIYR